MLYYYTVYNNWFIHLQIVRKEGSQRLSVLIPINWLSQSNKDRSTKTTRFYEIKKNISYLEFKLLTNN